MIKIRILPGDFGTYISKSGSWDEKKPDLNSFEVDVAALPAAGAAIVFTDSEDVQYIGTVQQVVLVGASLIYVFIPSPMVM